MSNDAKYDYWEEALQASYNHHTGELMDSELAANIAGDLAVSSEQESMAFGYDCIPNPQTVELEDKKRQHKREIEKMEEESRQNEREYEDNMRSMRIRYERRIEELEKEICC